MEIDAVSSGDVFDSSFEDDYKAPHSRKIAEAALFALLGAAASNFTQKKKRRNVEPLSSSPEQINTFSHEEIDDESIRAASTTSCSPIRSSSPSNPDRSYENVFVSMREYPQRREPLYRVSHQEPYTPKAPPKGKQNRPPDPAEKYKDLQAFYRRRDSHYKISYQELYNPEAEALLDHVDEVEQVQPALDVANMAMQITVREKYVIKALFNTVAEKGVVELLKRHDELVAKGALIERIHPFALFRYTPFDSMREILTTWEIWIPGFGKKGKRPQLIVDTTDSFTRQEGINNIQTRIPDFAREFMKPQEVIQKYTNEKSWGELLDYVFLEDVHPLVLLRQIPLQNMQKILNNKSERKKLINELNSSIAKHLATGNMDQHISDFAKKLKKDEETIRQFIQQKNCEGLLKFLYQEDVHPFIVLQDPPNGTLAKIFECKKGKGEIIQGLNACFERHKQENNLDAHIPDLAAEFEKDPQKIQNLIAHSHWEELFDYLFIEDAHPYVLLFQLSKADIKKILKDGESKAKLLTALSSHFERLDNWDNFDVHPKIFADVFGKKEEVIRQMIEGNRAEELVRYLFDIRS